MAEIKDILSRLEKAFNASKLNYVIVGGIAVIHYGHVRATQDIDLIIEDDAARISQFLNILRTCQFDVMSDQIKKAYREKTHFTIFDNKSFLRLDIKVAENPSEMEILRNAKSEKILESNLSIAPLEYVLLGKIIFLGNIEDIPNSELLEYQDIIDFLTLFNIHKEDVDLDFLMRKTEQIGLRKTLTKLIDIDFSLDKYD
ncbi:MAG: nucleotidyl transferase AbiEii/AbiGii toxin family protein [Promethearchaeia archaeon]